MNIGQLSILVAFFAALGATIAFYRLGVNQPGRKRNKMESAGKPAIAHRLFRIMSVAGLLASAVLLYAFLSHQFHYSYVTRYSSRSLPVMYLVSAFWAGQEGTFLLWAVLVNVLGIPFLKRKTGDGYAMAVVTGFSAFLYLLLLVKSPFEVLSPAPSDGSGLNPLLQDPWMAIHPPILFVGYAATVFPFALVVSALVRRNYESWFSSGFPWTLFATLALGAGIIIGGFWAYEVLGWGGYWGWDPVENSSLVPWIVLIALVHGLLVQKARNSLLRTNIVLALLSFLLVLYATFLTRSGVLADFSVHSFVDFGINNYLIVMLLLSTVVGFGLFTQRFREIRSQPIDTSNLNREVVVLLSVAVLLAAALFTFVGMSSPLLTGLFGKASQVDGSFYDKVNLPVALTMALLLGIAPFLGWTEESQFHRPDSRPPGRGLMKRLSLPLMLAGLSVAIAYVAGVTTLLLILFVAAAVFGLVSNAIIAFRQYRSGWATLGGPIAHMGVGLLFLGIIGSGSFDQTTQLLLQPGVPQSAYGYQFTFKGPSRNADQKDRMRIEVSDGRTTRLATPKLYYSQYNRAMMREPDIMILPLKDLYLSPLELRSSEAEHEHPMLELSKGETKELEGYKVTFVRFDVGQHGDAGAMAVGAVLNVNFQEKNHELIPSLSFTEQEERKLHPADLPAFQNPTKGVAKPSVTLNGVNVDAKKILLEFHGFDDHSPTSSTQALLIEISTKPLMMVVWTGVVLIIAGTAIAFKRRATGNGSSG